MKISMIICTLVLFSSCAENKTQDQASEVLVKESPKQRSISYSDLKELARLDSISFNREILEWNLYRRGIVYLYDSTIDISKVAFGDYMPYHIAALIRFDKGNLWYTFPIERLSYFKQSLIDDGAEIESQTTSFNDRLDINYTVERYYLNIVENGKATLQFYDKFGMITIDKY